MLTIAETRDKAEAAERLAATTGEPYATAYRDLARQWRMLEIEATLMDAMRASIAPESDLSL